MSDFSSGIGTCKSNTTSSFTTIAFKNAVSSQLSKACIRVERFIDGDNDVLS